MWIEAFAFLIQLPPLAFGPALPPPAFALPRALTCEIRDLGRIQEPVRPPWPAQRKLLRIPAVGPGLDRHFTHPALEAALILGALAATRGGWDDRPWGVRAWDATGAVTPVLIPPMAPPSWGMTHR
ncbi:hypothetical protein GETHLI_17710 [Geothrix limicola]|uniref:Uncharacterized protein n=1 Tax=Geothrix limicola TaxID=2927978 RepID=A0ABQ5QEK5_9BACT|nr:hypothetical protein [Geothrix limicola]GLH73269.1 hypothetical protein GETHLI_17710 [Geothrix limicola]